MDSGDRSITEPWVCPQCRGGLIATIEGARCNPCDEDFPAVGGILDLRPSLRNGPYDVLDARVEQLLRLAENGASSSDMAAAEFSGRGWGKQRVAFRVRQVRQGPARLEPDFSGWLGHVVTSDGLNLEIGCGTGGFLEAASRRGLSVAGVDVSMTWLLVARRRLEESGATPMLAAASADAVPLPSESVDSVVALDVVEHLPDLPGSLSEVDRLLKPGSKFGFSTPNRFSLSAEPHVGLLGVGWLPRKLQEPYVRWRTGDPYDSVLPLSSAGIRRLFRAHTGMSVTLIIPAVPIEEIDAFGTAKSLLARCYNAVRTWWILRPFFLAVGPFFQGVGTKGGRWDSNRSLR